MAQHNIHSTTFQSIFLSVALFVFLPFVHSIQLQDVEQTPRFLILSAVVFLSSLFSLFSLSGKPNVFKKDDVYYVVLVYLLICLTAFLRSINYGDGLFELLKISIYFSLFLQFILVFSRDERSKLLFFKTICIAVFVFIAFGLTQLFPSVFASLKKGKEVVINYAIASTLGNKNFFAETLLLMLPIMAVSIFLHRSLWRILFIIASLLIIISLTVLQTLSTWVALFFTAVLLFVLIYRWRNRIFTVAKIQKYFYRGIGVMILVTIISGIAFIQFAGTQQIKSRVTSLEKLVNPEAFHPDSVYENSFYERVSLWKNSVKIIASHPVSGVGLGNWKIISPAYGIGSASYMSTGVIRFVHPHNDFLFIASELGILGLLVFLVFIGWLFFYAFKLSARAENKTTLLLGLALICGLFSYCMISLFSLPTNRIYPFLLLMLFAAIIITENSRQGSNKKFISKSVLVFLLIVTAITGIAATLLASNRLRSEFHLSAALLKERDLQMEAMKRHLEKIDKKYLPVDATATPIAWYHGFSVFYLGNMEQAFALFKEAERANPNHLNVINDLGTAYNLSGDPVTAEQYYKKALTIQPGFGDAHVNLAVLAFNKGDLEGAYKSLVKHKGKIRKDKIVIFSTILLTKAKTITTDEAILDRFQKRLTHQERIMLVISEIQANKGDLVPLLKK